MHSCDSPVVALVLTTWTEDCSRVRVHATRERMHLAFTRLSRDVALGSVGTAVLVVGAANCLCIDVSRSSCSKAGENGRRSARGFPASVSSCCGTRVAVHLTLIGTAAVVLRRGVAAGATLAARVSLVRTDCVLPFSVAMASRWRRDAYPRLVPRKVTCAVPGVARGPSGAAVEAAFAADGVRQWTAVERRACV